MPRRFSQRQRNALYSTARGRCQNCGAPLQDGWHADHHTPWSKGGATHTQNGRALCPVCNLAKGPSMNYQDSFDPRPFQCEVIEAVVDGFATDRTVTVALGTPGTGKTLAYQATATHLLREGLIDYLAVFVPRLSLAEQCELEWMHQDKDTRELRGYFKLFDARLHFGKIRHVGNRPPLTQPGATGTGFVTTYSALSTEPVIFTDWAEEHRGRFLLVADEAQFCGSPDENGGGTRAGALIQELSQFAAHTLLLTGTPYRADGRPLVLADYSDDEEDGKARLVRQVEATYSDGIVGEYLRRFEFLLHEGKVTETDIARQWSVQYSISSKDVGLKQIMRQPTTWQPLADLVVQSVREKQILNPAYRGLISCMEKQDAESVANYLRAKYPGLRVRLALSSDGAAAQNVLATFKTEQADVLVTVRMAFIGYDCKTITVVGVLTHYRDKGHLMQLIGRGLRAWDKEPYDEQTCRIIAPDDLAMKDFLTWLTEQQEEGIRRREERQRGEGEGPERQQPNSLSFIEATEMTTVRAVGNDAEVGHDERLLLESLKRRHGLVADVTQLVGFLEDYGIRVKEVATEGPDAARFAPEPETPASAPMTDKQQIAEIGRQAMAEIRGYLADREVTAEMPGYSTYISKVTATVNKAAGVSSKDVRTIEQADSRLQAAKALRGRS